MDRARLAALLAAAEITCDFTDEPNDRRWFERSKRLVGNDTAIALYLAILLCMMRIQHPEWGADEVARLAIEGVGKLEPIEP